MSDTISDKETSAMHSWLDTDTVVHVCNREVYQGDAMSSRYFRFVGQTPVSTQVPNDQVLDQEIQ